MRSFYQVLISCAFAYSFQAAAQDKGEAVKSASAVNTVADITVADVLECGGQANYAYQRMKAVGLDGALLASLRQPVDFWAGVLATKNDKDIAEAVESLKLRHQERELEVRDLGLSGAERLHYLNATRIHCGKAIGVLKGGKND